MGKKILVVGDSQKDLAAIRRQLKKYGYDRVELIRTARETLQKIRSNPPALAIVNTQISDGDGYDVCKQIRKMNLDHMKIILLNSLGEMNNAQRAREVGADDLVVKTSDYLFLMNTIRKILPPE